MKLRSFLLIGKLVSQAIKTSTIEVQDIREVLDLVNEFTSSRYEIYYFENGQCNPMFKVIDRGYDVSLKFPPGYPTVFIAHKQTGETFKIGLDPRVDAILDEWEPQYFT